MKIGGHLFIMNSMSFQQYSEICKTGKVYRSVLTDHKGNYYRIRRVINGNKVYTFLFVNGELVMSDVEEKN